MLTYIIPQCSNEDAYLILPTLWDGSKCCVSTTSKYTIHEGVTLQLLKETSQQIEAAKWDSLHFIWVI